MKVDCSPDGNSNMVAVSQIRVVRTLQLLTGIGVLALTTMGATRWAPSAHLLRKLPNSESLFATSNGCISCHNGLSTSAGEDVSIGTSWRATMMANSSRDPYWQASVRREVQEHPIVGAAIQDKCATCHMPMARYDAHKSGKLGEVFAHLPIGEADEESSELAADGVGCTTCHQIKPENFGKSESFDGGFAIENSTAKTGRVVYGPYEIDSGRQRVMHSSSTFKPAQGTHIQKAELCATCHTLFTEARNAKGEVIGTLPEQVPYLEWQRSEFANTDPKNANARTCQSCHMPAVPESLAITGVLGQPRPSLARHDFRGGNFFMLRMLNKYRKELGVQALTPELEASAKRTVDHLGSETATIALEGVRLNSGMLEADVLIHNLSGHKLPTAYPSRRVWVHITARDANQRVVFESGAIGADGAIAGNDNDADGSTYEPHYQQITRADQVQIYESVMVDTAGHPTTGLLSAVRFAKDNRLLPRGFQKTGAPADVAVRGTALEDSDFTAGEDRVHYAVPLPQGTGPVTVSVELRYQPISFRWAKNLGEHKASEIQRFSTYYSSMSQGSSTVLAHAEAAGR